MRKKLHYIAASVLLIACQWTLGTYEKNIPIPRYAWDYDFKPRFTVHISDTTATYNIYVNLRHTDAYRYSNVWMIITTQFPGNTSRSQRVELPLADMEGKWLGTGMDDIFSHRILIQENAVFNQAGDYQFSFQQNMRVNPLRHVMSVGLRIEKSGKRTP